MRLKCAEPVYSLRDFMWQAYENLRIPSNKNKLTKNEVNKSVAIIGSILRDGLINYEGGVHINRLGYFNVWLSPSPYYGRESKFTGLPIFNTFIDNKTFCVSFSQECGVKSKIKGWALDFLLSSGTTEGILKHLKKGNIYMNMYEILRKLKNI